MPKSVILTDSKWRMNAWVDDTGDMQVVISWQLSGEGETISKSKDRTPTLTAAKRTAITNFAKAEIAGVKASEGM